MADLTIHRWSAGKAPLSQRWTEAVGRMLRPGESIENVTIRFNHWLKTGEWKVCQCCQPK
jgi:hypothetical protein